MTILLAIRTFLASLPWQAWVAVALLALLPLSYCKGHSDGKKAMLEHYEAAADKAKDKAIKAAGDADRDQAVAELTFEASQEEIRKDLKNAESTGVNSLDALFDGL